MKKSLIFAIITLLILLTLSLYDYSSTRRQFSDQGPSQPPTITLETPEAIDRLQPLNLNWSINSVTPRVATSTTIYWDNQSTPSALLSTDSPDAAGYGNSIPDYQNGIFNTPAEFTAQLTFTTPQLVYLRAYAFIEGRHYWTPEQVVNVR